MDFLSLSRNFPKLNKVLVIFFKVLGTKEENLLVGEPITCYVTAKNKTNKDLTISLTGVIRTIRYNGNSSYLVKTSKFDKVNISSQNGEFEKN